jgi:hypothetical protein
MLAVFEGEFREERPVAGDLLEQRGGRFEVFNGDFLFLTHIFT